MMDHERDRFKTFSLLHSPVGFQEELLVRFDVGLPRNGSAFVFCFGRE